ncbi:MAG: asparaginase [Thiolinea sp.]
MQANPVLVEVLRGDTLESRHRGSAIVLDTQGNTLLELGNADALVFPRSAIKLLQALPVLESGAAAALQLSDAELALLCASHNGEVLHTTLVNQLLQRLGLDSSALACGAEWPLYTEATHELLRQHQTPGREHHNCSGKHCGMLIHSQYQGWPLAGYHEYQHPAQQAWRQVLSELCQIDAGQLPWDYDGCGVPALALPLRNIALGITAFAAPEQHTPTRAAAMQRLLQAIAAYPMNIAGTGRACTRVISATQGRIIVKTGAEGVFTGVIPERRLGFALKMDDGAGRAAETALGGLLAALQEPVARDVSTRDLFRRQLKNSQAKVVGRVLPAAVWETRIPAS